MTKFIPMYDLASLTEEQRAEYYKNACEYYEVPAELNLLAFIFMDTGDGARNLVLYAKKGATDRIRDRKGITTTALTKDDGPGYVCFTAVGQDKNGRVERAVGAANIEGLHGQLLAAAVITAQTRATRRMTLQFVGGLLDESEVHNATTNIAQVSTPLSKIAQQPATQPNNAPGEVVPSVANPTADPVTQTQLDAQAALARVKPEVLAAAAGDSVTQNSPNEGVSLQEISVPKRRSPRPRKSANTDIPESQGSATSAIDEHIRSVAMAFPEPISTPITPVAAPPEPASAPEQAAPAIEAKPVEPPAPPAPKAGLPDADQQKAYRARWSEYVNKRLSKEGKMMPTEGVGGVSTKLQKFVLHLLPGLKQGEALTVDQWETVLNYLDNKYEDGAEELVKFIDGVVCK